MITYRKLTENELEPFIQMRITQLREEGAAEKIDLVPEEERAKLLGIHRLDLFLIVSFFFHFPSSCSPSAERERLLVHFNKFRGNGVFNGAKPFFLRKVKII